MNEQTSGQLRQLLQALGAIATTFGFATAGQVDLWIQIILQIAGPAMMLGGVIWSWKVNTTSALVASVDAMAKEPDSPVKGVITTNTKAGRELANEMPGMTTVVAGSTEAKIIATKPKE